MREIAILVAALAAGGCTPARMAGFNAVTPGAERLEMTGVPAWMNGSFALGTAGTRGTVRREVLGREQAQGLGERDAPAIERALVARYGRVTFEVDGPEVGGPLAGRCRYDRVEARVRSGPFTTSAPVEPLVFSCTFHDREREIGALLLHAVPAGRGERPAAARAGQVRLAGTMLSLRSEHRLARAGWPVERPVGYVASRGGVDVGAIEIVGGGRRRIALPADAATRRAMLAASLALALFDDPGDTDE